MGKTRKFKRCDNENLHKKLCMVLICLLILFIMLLWFSNANAKTNFVVVSGMAWADDNENGVKDDGESPLGNIDVFLCDQNGNHMRTSDGAIVSTKTDANGMYQFDANLGNYDKYTVRFQYDGLEYSMVEMIKQMLTYDVNSFLNKVNIVYNFPKTSMGRERIYQAKLNQFNISNKNEVMMYYDASGIYKEENKVRENNIILANMAEIGSLNLLNQKSIFFVYLDQTNYPSKDAVLAKLRQIQNSLDDNDYKIILAFSSEYADANYKNEIIATQSSRIKVVENEVEFEKAVAEYLAGRPKEEQENPFGEEDQNKRTWIEETFLAISASERQEYYQRGETKISATSYPLEANGKMVYISIGLKRSQNYIGDRDANDVTANDNGDKLVRGSVLWADDGSKVTNAPIKVELFQQIQTKEEYDKRISEGAYGEINQNPAENFYGMVLVGNPNQNKVVKDDGTYAIAYPEMGVYKVRFTYGHNSATQAQDINGEKCQVPEGAIGVSRNEDTGKNNAAEIVERRNQINQYFMSDEDGDGFAGINNFKTRLSKRQLDMKELIEKTQMVATTDWFTIWWYIDTDGEEPDESEPPPTMYANLVLKRRQIVDFKVNNEIEALTLQLSDGRMEKELTKQKNGKDFLDPTYLQIDDEIIHGSTLKVQYRLTIKNTGELPITSMRIMDYLDYEYGNLHYIPEEKMLTENKKNQDYGWKHLTNFKVEEGANDPNFQQELKKDKIYLEYVHKGRLEPGEEIVLRLVGTVAISKRDDLYNYANAVEVISYNNEIGRVHENSFARQSIATVGNLNPSSEVGNSQESDQAFAQEVLITPPTGIEEY